MFSAQTYANRRQKLRQQISSGIGLFLGNEYVGMNYGANTYHFRQDSNFLYFFGIDRSGLAAVIDFESGEEIVFGDELTLDDIIWVGAGPTIAEQAEEVGIKKSMQMAKLAEYLNEAKSKGRKIHFTPPYRSANKVTISNLLAVDAANTKAAASEEMIRGIVALRSIKEAQEIVEIEKAVNTTANMHISAMRAAQKGMLEAEVAAVAHGISVAADGTPSFPIICSTDGQTLHNHHHGNKLRSGKLLLLDCGAEAPSRYAGDMTRTFPVDAKFTQKQREIYQIVLDSQVAAAEALKPGVPYRDIHLLSAMVITEGLKSLGLMKGNTEEAVAAGAHALFFPHGLGHMMGLDVHDMEDLGEDYVGYSEKITRSSLFGTAYLRLGRELESGFVLTVEPGIYFIPELIDLWSGDKKHSDFINYDKLSGYRSFGGIRIEEDFVITENGARLLGKPVPKTIADVEAARDND